MRIYKFCIQPGLQPKIQVRRYVIMLLIEQRYLLIFSLNYHCMLGMDLQYKYLPRLYWMMTLTVLMFFIGEEQNTKLIKWLNDDQSLFSCFFFFFRKTHFLLAVIFDRFLFISIIEFICLPRANYLCLTSILQDRNTYAISQ